MHVLISPSLRRPFPQILTVKLSETIFSSPWNKKILHFSHTGCTILTKFLAILEDFLAVTRASTAFMFVAIY